MTDPTSSAVAGLQELTQAERRAADVGVALLLRLRPAPTALRVVPAPEIGGVSVHEPVRGGRTVHVGPDGTVLFTPSAVPPHQARARYLAGERTPPERFGARGSGDG